MAHLNLRDRVIETTLAYLGAKDDEAAKNLEVIARAMGRGQVASIDSATSGTGRILSVELRPAERSKFRDCDLSVKVLAPEGPTTAATVERILVDADGLVLMLEDAPEDEDRNTRAVTLVREALARAPDRKTPVVVRVGAGSASHPAFVEALRAVASVSLSVSQGEGVVETLQRAVDEVVQTMQARAEPGVEAPQTAGAPRTTGNPLLGALRQILEATVSERVGSLDARLERLEAAVADLRPGQREPPVTCADLAEMEARVIEALTGAVGTLTREVEALRTASKSHVSTAATAELAEGLDEAVAKGERAERRIVEVADEVHALATKVDDLLKKTKKTWF